jgi:Thiamine monophosphate kinase
MNEYSLTEEITSEISTSPSVVVAPGEDDCSVINVEDYGSLTYNSEIRYSRSGSITKVCVAAKEAIDGLRDSEPIGVLVFLGVPSENGIEDTVHRLQEEITGHIEDGVDHLGGDTNETETLTVAVTAVGGIESGQAADAETQVDFSEMNYALHSMDMINATLVGEEVIKNKGKALGYYVADANISDVIASGSVPPMGIQAFGGIGDREVLEGVRDGIQERTDEYGMKNLEDVFTGADIDQMLGATVVGGVRSTDELTLRSGAQDGDIVLATGSPGVFTAATLAIETDTGIGEELRGSLIEYLTDTGVPVKQLRYLGEQVSQTAV